MPIIIDNNKDFKSEFCLEKISNLNFKIQMSLKKDIKDYLYFRSTVLKKYPFLLIAVEE